MPARSPRDRSSTDYKTDKLDTNSQTLFAHCAIAAEYAQIQTASLLTVPLSDNSHSNCQSAASLVSLNRLIV
jgi:hypothetical protein